MNTAHQLKNSRTGAGASRRGSILVVVLWIVFGLVTITLYFANTMSLELRASDNRTGNIEAGYAIEAARRYVTCVLSNLNSPGVVPDPQSYRREAVEVGTAKFWIIGRTNLADGNITATTPLTFALIDESSKMNLNATWVGTNLSLLPRMTPDLANNIAEWKSSASNNTTGGADASSYMMLQPPYLCKNAPYETLDELRLVYNMNIDLLYGEDANLNGILDPNENDGDTLPPTDNLDGRLDPGLFEYLTVYTHEPTTISNGVARVNVFNAAGVAQLSSLLTAIFGDSRAQQILASAGIGGGGGGGGRGFGGGGGGTTTFTSPLHFYMVSGMTPAEFSRVETNIMGQSVVGLVNVNTASAAVLTCLPGMDAGKANQLISFRQSNQGNTDYQNSVSWVAQVLDAATALAIGPYITGHSYQFMADVVAVGHQGRGYKRVRFVFDVSSGTPTVIYRQDLSHLGWALGKTQSNPQNKTTLAIR